MADEDLTIEDDPRPEDVATLSERLYEYNADITGRHDGRHLAVFVRDGEHRIVAGLSGWTWGQTGFVQNLWVQRELRGRGLGQRLLDAAEREAERRGCHEMHLDTHSYQAPDFYRRTGYEEIGVLPGWPGDTTRIFFRKPLTPRERTS